MDTSFEFIFQIPRLDVIITIVFTIAFTSLMLWITRKIFRRIQKYRNNVYIGFLQGIAEAVVVILGVASLARLSSEGDTFINTMVMSSSVIAVVLGFIFQEGTKNIVHGFFISIYKPFDIGDRIRVTTGNKDIDGYVEALTLSNTIVRDANTNVRDVIPNALMDSCTIENFSRLGSNIKSGCAGMTKDGLLPNMDRLYVEITYESDVEKAREIIARVVMSHPGFIDYRPDPSKPVDVYITDFLADGINLMVYVSESTRTKLFYAMCDDREKILKEFAAAGVEIAYPHMQVLGEVAVSERNGNQNENRYRL